MELEFRNYRAAMVQKMYQAQVKCTGCGAWVLTSNLEVFKNEAGERVADAANVTCTNSGCGEKMGTVTFLEWPYSAPAKWRYSLERVADDAEAPDGPAYDVVDAAK